VVRAVRILDLLAHSDEPLTLTEIADRLDIPKSTAYGILRDLVQEAFVATSKPTAYSIGLRAFEIGSAHLRRVGVPGIVTPELNRLTSALGVTSHYAILDRTDVVYLCKEDPPGLGVRLASSVGARLPAHLTAVGKACLAWVDQELLVDHVAAGPSGQDSMSALLPRLRAELEQVRRLGFATDDGQVAPGIACAAAPVFDVSGCRGALGVSYMRDQIGDQDELVRSVRETAGRITALLGGTPS
jgi:DNA-binding IclR family transcriptional regulator